MPDTVSPYDDEVVDPYSGDDTKNPHEETEGDDDEQADEEGDDEEAPKPKRGRPRKSVS